jgi:hypothetical protein
MQFVEMLLLKIHHGFKNYIHWVVKLYLSVTLKIHSFFKDVLTYYEPLIVINLGF